jgi:branched-chain amino acid transport system substrate-binding protein
MGFRLHLTGRTAPLAARTGIGGPGRAMRRFGGIARALTGAMALMAAGLQAGHAQDAVKIGVPCELSGRFVAYGSQCKRGVEMAVDVFGGTVLGKKIDPVYRDVQSNNQVAVTAFTELADQQKIDFIIGPVASGVVAASVAAWRQSKPLWLVPGSSSTVLEKAMKGEDLFFHTYPWAYDYYESTAAAVEPAAGAGKKVAIIYSDGAYGREEYPYAQEYYRKNGFEIVATELVREGAADFNPVLQQLRRLHPDVLVGIVQTTDAIQLTKQLQVARLNIPFLVGTAYPQLKEWSDAVGPEAANGWIAPTNYLPALDRPADPKYPKLFPSSKEWEAAFKARYNRSPEFLDMTCYTTAMLLLVAIEEAKTTDKARVAETLAKLDLQTGLGTSKFGPTPGGTLHQAFSQMIVYQRQGDRLVVVYPSSVAQGKIVPRQ